MNKLLAIMGNATTNKKNGGNGNHPAGRVYNLEGDQDYGNNDDELEVAAIEANGTGLMAGQYLTVIYCFSMSIIFPTVESKQ